MRGLHLVPCVVGPDRRRRADFGDPERDIVRLVVGLQHGPQRRRHAEECRLALVRQPFEDLVGMNADVVKMVAGAGLDRGVDEADVEISHAEADLGGGIDALGCQRCLAHQFGIHRGRAVFGEAAVELVPDLPVFDAGLIPPDHACDIVAPKLDVLDGKPARAAVCRRPGSEIGQHAGQMDRIRLGVLQQTVGQGEIPRSWLRLNRLPFVKATEPSRSRLFQHRIEDGVGGKPFRS